ncbi:P-loop containing nucleoside triphosphate hydrolases superfamily protein [Theobroma cacao]|uniref:P-loop containing nucleoside triphosphate hydrolases superfamily protein n=1 Tax=Theobroma cacao TaxID=3641 RepID=A0A061F364_THECC|nr:P-loop containing nucleoside triphosphate hydrolases superfamily protein [Theobroma cacao]
MNVSRLMEVAVLTAISSLLSNQLLIFKKYKLLIFKLSIFIIEDIDYSLDITKKHNNCEKDEKDEKKNRVTLLRFLNFVDGIWSKRKIIVFTTNHINKLDPTLIRKRRMNMHIELSYCTRGGFKVSAKNYLNLDPHPLFEKIGDLLKDVNMTPADISEHLIHGRVERDVNACLESLIQTLETAKEEEEEDAKKKQKQKLAIFKGISIDDEGGKFSV